MTKTSHKKNRPFDFKLIDLVEPHAVLYQRETGLNTYERMKAKNILWEEISDKLGVTVQFCIMRWSNLRGQFQKELRHCRELCPKEGVIRGSTWPYLERMRFLENTVLFNKPRRIRRTKRKQVSNMCQQDDLAEESMSSEGYIGQETGLTDNDEQTCDMDFNSEDIISELLQDEDDAQDKAVQEVTIMDNSTKCIEDQQSSRSSAANLQKISTLLMGIEGDNRTRVERRIMAFLCKCQLRAFANVALDDLVI